MTAVDSGLTFVDLFCGAGGSSTGLVQAGFELKLAANHWQRAIETHSANHPGAEHWCADINQVDMRRLPKARVLWASPICTEISPAGGKKRTRGQLSLMEDGHVSSAAFERTRATALDVIRATEVHRYDAVMCENVVEFATNWELFDWWLNGMSLLGYQHQIISANSAHLTDDPAPQWRDRIYMLFMRNGIKMPTISPSPWAWCFECGKNVQAVQTWRGTRRIGKYRQQYDYRCPERSCKHSIVDPWVRPAASIIDWSNLGQRIGDRKKPLAENTMARIRAGRAMFPADRTVLTINHGGHDGRPFPADQAPFASRTVKIGDGILVPAGGGWNTTASTLTHPMRTVMANEKGYEAVLSEPYIVEYRNHADASSVADPLATITAGGNHHGLVVPEAFLLKNYGGNCSPSGNVEDIAGPIGTVVARDGHALVIPYRAGNRATTTRDPLYAVSTHDSAALLSRAADIEDCHFRMVQPREQLSAQAFPREYVVYGNQGEQTMQAGNSVSVNAARWIGEPVAEVLGVA